MPLSRLGIEGWTKQLCYSVATTLQRRCTFWLKSSLGACEQIDAISHEDEPGTYQPRGSQRWLSYSGSALSHKTRRVPGQPEKHTVDLEAMEGLEGALLRAPTVISVTGEEVSVKDNRCE